MIRTVSWCSLTKEGKASTGDERRYGRGACRWHWWERAPAPTWKTFLKNHVQDLVAMDFFVAPTVTFRVLFAVVSQAHDRRRIVYFNVTEHPTVRWMAH